jgi:RHS repeat-associated protein
MRYDAFGRITWLSAAFATKGNSDFAWSRTFTGQVLDNETGMMLYRNRFYHAGLGRFVQRDPIGYRVGEVNLFRYSRNKPLIYTDPSGYAEEQSGERSIAERREECCTELKRQVDAGRHPNIGGADGIAICCGDTPISCIFTDGDGFRGMTNERARAIFAVCLQFHESQHVWDLAGLCPKCPESDTQISFSSFPFLEGDDHLGAPGARAECRALRTELACLRIAIFACYDDIECGEKIRDRITYVDNKAHAVPRGACFGHHPYDPHIA